MYFRMMPFFSDIHISQGSVATCLKRGRIFKHEFVANLLPNPLVKKIWKWDNSWWRYGQEFRVLFFHSRCSMMSVTHTFVFVFSPQWQVKSEARFSTVSICGLRGNLISWRFQKPCSINDEIISPLLSKHIAACRFHAVITCIKFLYSTKFFM